MKLYRVLITGASGNGKSTFICYALAKVLIMQESTLVILSTEKQYVVIDMNKGALASVKRIVNDTDLTVYINRLPKDKRFWFLWMRRNMVTISVGNAEIAWWYLLHHLMKEILINSKKMQKILHAMAMLLEW